MAEFLHEKPIGLADYAEIYLIGFFRQACATKMRVPLVLAFGPRTALRASGVLTAGSRSRRSTVRRALLSRPAARSRADQRCSAASSAVSRQGRCNSRSM